MSEQGWIDKQGDVWRLGADGLMHTPETAPFPREYVERKWGPLREVRDMNADMHTFKDAMFGPKREAGK